MRGAVVCNVIDVGLLDRVIAVGLRACDDCAWLVVCRVGGGITFESRDHGCDVTTQTGQTVHI